MAGQLTQELTQKPSNLQGFFFYQAGLLNTLPIFTTPPPPL